MYNPTVTVIINTYNRAAHLKRLLDVLSRQTYRDFEVVVVNGPSTDDTNRIIRQYKKAIRTGRCPAANLSMSRNIGLRKAAGDIIAFIDDDAVPQDARWIENAVGYFEDEKVGIVAGAVYRLGGQPEYRYGWFDIWGHNNSVQDRAVIYDDPQGERFSCGQGCNLFFRAAAIAKAGGFDEYYAYYLDESDLGMRIIQCGYTCRYGEHMAVLHEAASGPYRKAEYHENMFVIARSHGYFVLKATEKTGKPREEREAIARQSVEVRAETMKRRLEQKLISQEEYKELVKAIWDGVEQGIRDSNNKRRLNPFARPDSREIKQFDKTLSSEHKNLCVLCESSKEDMADYAGTLIKDISDKDHNIFVVIRGSRTKLELVNGVNYCTVKTEGQTGREAATIRDSAGSGTSNAVYPVLQELIHTFGIQMMITPVRDASIIETCVFSTDRLLVTGDGSKNGKSIGLLNTGIQYGPYIDLPRGRYEVVYTGNNLHVVDDFHVTSDTGKRLIQNEITEKSDHKVRYSFSVDERTSKVEFVAVNHHDSLAEVFEIELKQTGI